MLGENIILHRKRLGISQQTLAEKMYIVRQTVSKWEKNLSVPDADALVRLADALDTTVQALLDMPPEAPSPAAPDMAAALMRINDQLAIQNRRRRRVWTVAAWLLGLFVGIHMLLIILGLTFTADPTPLQMQDTTVTETTVVTDGAE